MPNGGGGGDPGGDGAGGQGVRQRLAQSGTIFAPLRVPLFRRVWIAGVFSNLGTLIQAVAAAWTMTSLTSDASLVALVQTASSAPMMLFAIVAGALADLYDRRNVALMALVVAALGAAMLTIVTGMGLATPTVLLLFCFMVGCGTTLFAPAWQASVRDQVPREDLPAAVALNSISFSLGRSLGPAIGGVIVALAGAFAAFAVNALSFLPIFIVLLLWRRPSAQADYPRERLGRAIGLGVRYMLNAPAVRTALVRVIIHAFGNSAILALLALFTREILGGDALVYGLSLGAFGFGAVAGASLIPRLRKRFSGEVIIRATGIIMGCALLAMSVNRSTLLTVLILMPAGACWTIASAMFNVAVQTSAPQWIAGRALATFQTAIAGGVAIGSWCWGVTAQGVGITSALAIAGVYIAVVQILGRWLRVPDAADLDDRSPRLPDPDMQPPVDGRTGPVTIILEYRIALEQAGEFRRLMEEIRLGRRRSGAGGWTIARDLGDAELWIERFHFPTWHDYLRFRNRSTTADRRLLGRLRRMHRGEALPMARRFVERPSIAADLPRGAPIADDNPLH